MATFESVVGNFERLVASKLLLAYQHTAHFLTSLGPRRNPRQSFIGRRRLFPRRPVPIIVRALHHGLLHLFRCNVTDSSAPTFILKIESGRKNRFPGEDVLIHSPFRQHLRPRWGTDLWEISPWMSDKSCEYPAGYKSLWCGSLYIIWPQLFELGT